MHVAIQLLRKTLLPKLGSVVIAKHIRKKEILLQLADSSCNHNHNMGKTKYRSKFGETKDNEKTARIWQTYRNVTILQTSYQTCNIN